MRLPFKSAPLSGQQLTRLAVLLTFCDPLPEQCSRICTLSSREWKSLLCWLDVSGLALYFFNRIVERGLGNWLPSAVFERLQLNLIDNTERTRGMISESIAIQQEFQNDGLCYALLKGLSLWPESVQQPELRLQFDLDFLVDEISLPRARKIIEDRGYRLYAAKGRSWEFKLNQQPGISLNDIYKHVSSFTVELHVQPNISNDSSPLKRLQWRELRGMHMPVLAPVDLFLGQGLHVFKHLCEESSRASHMLEFRRHILARHDDNEFWDQLQSAAAENPRASVGLGVVVLLITQAMGEFAPDSLKRWTVETLPQPFRLWVEMYGHRALLDGYPGSKLYLLLQGELEHAGSPRKRSLRRSLVFCLPPPLIRARPNESMQVRARRYFNAVQVDSRPSALSRCGGVPFTFESRRFRRMKELLQ